MLEDILFGKLVMPGEAIRIIAAFIGVAIASYFDLFNKKNVPDIFLYAFLGIAFLINLVFYSQELFFFSLAVAAFFSAIGYLFYRVGQLGGADVFVLAAVMLLLPVHPSLIGMTFNLPFILSLIIFSGVAFAVYSLLYFGLRITTVETKPNLVYLLLGIPYAVFAYVYLGSFLFSPIYFAFITIMLFAVVFFLVFKESLNQLLAEELPISQVANEDVLALELMNKDLIDKYKIPRLMNAKAIEKLKEAKLETVLVYTKLPPFIPFIFIGMVLAMLFAKNLLFI